MNTVSALPDTIHYMGWQAYFRNFFISRVARVGHVFPVGMEASLVLAFKPPALVLRQGRGVLVCPEGQRSVDGMLRPLGPASASSPVSSAFR